jgi:NADH-quinone oxidoreductase subunit H
MVSYEVTLGLTLVPCFMWYSSLRLEEMASYQHDHGLWGIAYPPLLVASLLYLVAATAESKRMPFDAPEGESEIVGGYFTEYSGMKFGMFYTGEFIEVIALSALFAVLFLGGWDVPFLFRDGWDLPGTFRVQVPGTPLAFTDYVPLSHMTVIIIEVLFFFFVKMVFAGWAQLMVRWSLPRFRYDQIMALCWKGLLPLALLNIFFTAAWILVAG